MAKKNKAEQLELEKDELSIEKENIERYNKAKTYNINTEAWTAFLSYYRYYVDKFAYDILNINTLYPFQKLLLRIMARFPNTMILACRGLTKSFITAIFCVCMAILYPGISIGIVSGTGKQAQMVILQKILGELINNENIEREIASFRTAQDDCHVKFKNGSMIRAVALGAGNNGDNMRGWRFQIVLVDESRLVRSDILKAVIEPTTTTPRANFFRIKKENPHIPHEHGRIIHISSAFLKTCDFYQRFLQFYKKMTSGDNKTFVASLDHTVGEDAGLFSAEYIEDRRKENTSDVFTYEYCGTFVGSSNDSYYPYDITSPCRVLDKCELSQPKKTTSLYIVTHDVATSTSAGSDNSCTHVIKLSPKSNGTFDKSVVYTKTLNGVGLKDQRDLLRELVHIRFPNTEKLVIDERSAGIGLLALLEEPWSYVNDKGEVEEFPPLICDDDDEASALLPEAIPMIRGISATADFNSTYYPYMKSCFEDKSIKLVSHSEETKEKYSLGKYSLDEQMIHVEQDFLVQELSNIKKEYSDNNIRYDRIVKKNKRDRATSLMYGLSVVYEYERQGKADIGRKDVDIFSTWASYLY